MGDLRSLDPSGHFPTDFYGGGPFHYDAKRRVFWSVGENGVDDGGAGSAWRGLDMVWPIP